MDKVFKVLHDRECKMGYDLAVSGLSKFKILWGSVYEDIDSFDGGCDGPSGGAGGDGTGSCRFYRSVQGWDLFDGRQQTGRMSWTPGCEGVVRGGTG
jgi:hypothetical protein